MDQVFDQHTNEGKGSTAVLADQKHIYLISKIGDNIITHNSQPCRHYVT
jgi:hypothetical protein